ncbi:MAG: CDP-alcohol phosphatidyltransferase family protein [Flavisolibacter sp.]
MKKTAWYFINGLTLYRVLASLLLFYLILRGNRELFRFLLPLSFFTDAIDGILARKFRVASILGTRLDSLGDDLTVLMGIIGIYVFERQFLQENFGWVFVLAVLLIMQFSIALYRYGKFTSYHTYLAKFAALLQGSFLILFFWLSSPPVILFYCAAIITILELIEEIALVLFLPAWKANVKGLYWVRKELLF